MIEIVLSRDRLSPVSLEPRKRKKKRSAEKEGAHVAKSLGGRATRPSDAEGKKDFPS